MVSSFLLIFSCTKINEATTLGGDLIPPVDNVNTFEKTLATVSNNALLDDSTKLFYSDIPALGFLNDPEFGQTDARLFFNLSSTVYGTYPFLVNRASIADTLHIDSVVLSLAYMGAYGDTMTRLNVEVSEIAQNSGFVDSVNYPFDQRKRDYFQTSGPVLGSKSFGINELNDSIRVVNKVGDTVKKINVLRIPLNNSFGSRLASYDTTLTMNGGFYSDSIFRTLFRGFAIKSTMLSGQGALSYFNLSNFTDTKLLVYFRSYRPGKRDTTTAEFIHNRNGQASIIKRTPAGGYASVLASGPSADPVIYLQSGPGSYAAIKIPGLDTFSNKIIHRAELIVSKIPSSSPISDNFFTAPDQLILDRIHYNSAGDTSKAFVLDKDLNIGLDGSIGYNVFGGNLRSDNTYRFNITRHVQGIITRGEPNDSLRLYAPLRTLLYSPALATNVSVPVIDRIGEGRVVLAGGDYPDPKLRLRLRIIYSNL